MTEGIRYTVSGAELREALLKKGDKHREASASVIATPTKDADEAMAREFLFLADHVNVNGTYLLTRWECQEAGLTPSIR